HDGITVSMVDRDGTIEFHDRSGELLGTYDPRTAASGGGAAGGNVQVDTDGTPMLIDDDGTVIYRVTDKDYESFSNMVTWPSVEYSLAVLYSTDGLAWSRDDVDEIGDVGSVSPGG
ncbi:MAG TPA: hypothetical protein PLV68_09050, partial [Ilumatobacteraceae bacterium]|nr:hypothetical protein [Ilumatobacteraceae bacterium]